MPFEDGGILHFDLAELKQKLEDTEDPTIMIDVREPHEYEAGHIPGIPSIPMGEIPQAARTMDPSAPYVFICQGGVRSYNVAFYLQQNGFTNVYNFAGGMLAWDGKVTTGAEHVPESYDPDALKRKS